MSQTSRSDRWLAVLKNHPIIAVLVVFFAVVGAIAQFTGALRQLGDMIWSEAARQQASYTRLASDLRAFSKALDDFGGVELTPDTLQPLARFVLNEAEPVCLERRVLADLGDDMIRSELDSLCSGVESFRNLTDPEFERSIGFNSRVVAVKALAVVLSQRAADIREQIEYRD